MRVGQLPHLINLKPGQVGPGDFGKRAAGPSAGERAVPGAMRGGIALHRDRLTGSWIDMR